MVTTVIVIIIVVIVHIILIVIIIILSSLSGQVYIFVFLNVPGEIAPDGILIHALFCVLVFNANSYFVKFYD